MSRKFVSSFLTPPTLLDSSSIAEVVKAIPEDLNKNNSTITTFSPVCLREGEVPQTSVNLHHNNLMNSKKRRKSGNWRAGKELPPLPLESELFTPPVEMGRRAERSISVLAQTFLGMMPTEGNKVVMIKETAIMMNTSIKRVYTICNVLEGLRLMERKGQNKYEWKGFKFLMPTMMLLMQMALKENMGEIIDKVIDSEDGHGVQNVDASESESEHKKPLNICMLTQKLMMVFLVLPQPKVISLPVATTVIHGAEVRGKQRVVCLQKLWDVSKILQEVGLIQKVTIRQGSEKPVLAYQYVGETVELVTVEIVGEAVASSHGDENTSGLGEVQTEAINDGSKTTEPVDEGRGDCIMGNNFVSVGIKVEVDDKVMESREVSEVDGNDENLNSSRVLIDEDSKVIKLRIVLEDEVSTIADLA